LKNNITAADGVVKYSAAFTKKMAKITNKKKGNDFLAFTYEKTNLPDKDKKALKLRICGKTLYFTENPTGGDPIQFGAMRCELRLCPSCSWIRAQKIFQNVHDIIAAPEFSGKEFVFLTLTFRNCPAESLELEINRILSAWNKLTKDKLRPFRKSFLGTFRALEVNYEKDNPPETAYHPHLHAMAAVDPEYFRESNPDYISHDKLLQLWRQACKLNYDPYVHIEKVYSTTKKQVAEVAKYTVKSADYLNRPAVLEAFDTALKNKRLIAYGGLFKAVRNKLNLPDEDAVEELPRMTVEELLANPYIQKIMADWDVTQGAYKFSLMKPSADPAEWLEPGRIAAELHREQAEAWKRGQGGA